MVLYIKSITEGANREFEWFENTNI